MGSAEKAGGRDSPWISYMTLLMCFSRSTRFVKASHLVSTILILATLVNVKRQEFEDKWGLEYMKIA